MRLCRSTFVLVTSVTYLGVAASTTTIGAHFIAPVRAASNSGSLDVAQASPSTAAKQLPLRRGSRGPAVMELQTQLKQLGYYDGAVDGLYGKSTKTAVSQFQKAVGLTEDGIVGPITWNRLQAAQAKKTTPAASSTTPQRSTVARRAQWDWLWWSLVLVGVWAAVGGLLYMLRQFVKAKDTGPETPSDKVTPTVRLAESRKASAGQFDANPANTHSQPGNNGYNSSALTGSEDDSKGATAQPPIDVLAVEPPTRFAKINIVDELIKGLRSPNPTRRLMAIWDLGQEGDSRAVQPLLELMLGSDSQQRSLILMVLAEIGSRSLKPMNRALAISLQDENAEVRKNAIRDLTRIYDLIIQISQVLCHAVEDPDAEVQETARYALSQMNRIRDVPAQGSLSAGNDSLRSPETPPGEPKL